ncbi:MAG TPA: PT domain-containing protein [Puia sp.]|jgi:UDP-2,3-diacylglucosamine pyrophosphatase LpxH|nr:PT domain-containing protein [Puia sp.]
MPIQQVTELLTSCESTGAAPPYIISEATYHEQKHTGGLFSPDFPKMTDPVNFISRDEEIFVISDLHIAAGKDSLGAYSGLENFFADEAFHRFLNFADAKAASHKRKALLVINGDTFDFLRVTAVPTGPNEIAAWQEELRKLKIDKTAEALQNSISPRERKYGLETEDYKSIYKLMQIRQGHPLFFTSVAAWIGKGHRLVILKGNHDLEIVWPAVRNYLRLLIAEVIAGTPAPTGTPATSPTNAPTGTPAPAPTDTFTLEIILRNAVLPRIHFIDDAVLIDNTLYLEHGHRYDKYTMVLGSPFIERKGHDREINIPFGSFFNRYLINRVELAYPYFDKVRPTGNILPTLISQNFPLALKMFGSQVPLFIRVLFTNRRYMRFMFGRVAPLLLAALPVLAFLFWQVYPLFAAGTATTTHAGTSTTSTTGILQTLVGFATKGLESVCSLVMSYFLARIVAAFQLVEPSSLDEYAQHVCRLSRRNYPVMSMGHTHNPSASDPKADDVFFNTGTWIPVIETSTLDVREDKMYTFLRLERDADGNLTMAPNPLERWNDDAGRADPQLLIRPK